MPGQMQRKNSRPDENHPAPHDGVSHLQNAITATPDPPRWPHGRVDALVTMAHRHRSAHDLARPEGGSSTMARSRLTLGAASRSRSDRTACRGSSEAGASSYAEGAPLGWWSPEAAHCYPQAIARPCLTAPSAAAARSRAGSDSPATSESAWDYKRRRETGPVAGGHRRNPGILIKRYLTH
jgi:hypothetical protein